jgi:hypothetical protein
LKKDTIFLRVCFKGDSCCTDILFFKLTNYSNNTKQYNTASTFALMNK